MQCLQLVRICPYVFIRILRGIYGYTETMLHYTEERRRHVEVKYACVCCLLWSTEAYESDASVSALLNGTDNEAYGGISLASSDSYGPSLKRAKVLASDRKHSRLWKLVFPWILIMVQNIYKSVNKYWMQLYRVGGSGNDFYKVYQVS